MNKIILGMLLSAMTLSVFADNFNLSKQEQSQIENDAENWIDDMPDGLQDRLSDAVAHAMSGFYSELEYVRNMADTIGSGKYKVDVKEIAGGGNAVVPMRIYKPKKPTAQPMPLLVYFHGGGWTMGSLQATDKFCRALASMGKIMVVSVDYPLAPEKPYPAALDVCGEAVKYIESKAKEWGSSPTLISLGGDGAGGNLCLATYMDLPASVKIRSMVLFYPLINTTGAIDPEAKRKFGRGYGFDSRVWESYINAYKGQSLELSRELPPTLLIGAGRDIVVTEIKEFSIGNNITYVQFDGALHGFVTDGHQKTAFNKAVELTNLFLAR